MFEFTRVKIITGVIILILLIVSVVGYFFVYRPTQAVTQSDDVVKLIEEISKIYDLPSETPTVATVSDVSKLKNQPFFAKAKNGDKVLIFQQAKKAILYDPVSKKIVEVAPINDNNTPITDQEAENDPSQIKSASPSASITATPASSSPNKAKITSKILLSNGAGVRGLAATVQKNLKKQQSDINIVRLDNTENKGYESTLVIVIKKSSVTQSEAESLAKMLGAKVGSLPAGEIDPKDADLMVIIGKDQQ